MQNFFELFGLSPAFLLNKAELEKAYREIQSTVHPDRFAAAGAAERRASLDWTTRVNQAYRTLRDPVQRAKHLLDLQGVDVAFETNTAMPVDFLARQLEFRESLELAVKRKDAKSLEALRNDLRTEKQSLEQQIGERIDASKDYTGSVGLVRKLMFLHRLDEEIDAAYEEVE